VSPTPGAEALRHTPLYERHREAGGRLVPFAGFSLPVEYTGIIDEHRAVRRSAGLFDVSHMGQIRLRGRDAVRLAQQLFTNDVVKAARGRVRYGLFLRDDGGAIDDVTVYRVAAEEVFFCVNAANTAVDLDWIRAIRERSSLDCEIADESEATALLAVQGPRALEIAHRALGDAGPPPARWQFRSSRFAGAELCLSRTGYTGEDGYEIYLPAERAGALWDALLKAGGDELRPAGLGARDTLRTEMAYPLYGHELDPTTDPIEAGLERFVALGRGFIGESALRERSSRADPRRLVGLVLEGRSVARPPAPICAEQSVGHVTSGTFGPSVERSIAMGYVPARYAEPGTALLVEIRGRRVPCRVCKTPFYDRKGG
jgi:aminomethyltransferase